MPRGRWYWWEYFLWPRPPWGRRRRATTPSDTPPTVQGLVVVVQVLKIHVLGQVAALLLQLTVGPVRLLLQRQHRGRQAPGQTKGLPFRRAERHPAVEHRIVQNPRYGRGRRGASVHD